MAFVQTLSPEEEEQKKQGVNAPELSAAGGEISGTTGPGTTSLPSPQVSGKGGFTDVGAYLDANREQASQMGDVVAGKIGQEASDFKSGVDTAFSGFGSEIESARNKPNAGLVDEAISNPTIFAGDQGKTDAFKKMLSGEYAGPKEFDPNKLAEFSQKASDLKAKAPSISSSEGTKNYLYGTGRNPTLGQVELDNLLIGQDPTARGKIDTAAASFQTLQDYLDQANTAATGKITDAEAEAGKAKDEAGRLKTYGDTFTQGLSQRAADENTKAASLGGSRARLQNIYNELAKPGTGNLSPDDLNFLEGIIGTGNRGKFEGSLDFSPFHYQGAAGVGLSPEAFDKMNDPLQFSEFFTPGQDPTSGGADVWNVTTKDEAAKLNALENLLDESYGITGDPDRLGTYQGGTVAGANASTPGYDFGLVKTLTAHPGGGAESNAQRQKDLMLSQMQAAGIDTTRKSIPNGRVSVPEPEADWANRILEQYLAKRDQFWA